MSILIVDDHPLVRKGIIDILKINRGLGEFLETDNVEEALKILKMYTIDAIIVDLHLKIDNGFDLIEQVKTLNTHVKIIVLTSSSSLMDFQHAKQLQVDGYILKDAFIEDISYALNVIKRGEKYYSLSLIEYTMNGCEPKELRSLTEREKEVFLELSKGLSNAQISDALYITEGTTKKHISNILSKLSLNNRVEALLYARSLDGYL